MGKYVINEEEKHLIRHCFQILLHMNLISNHQFRVTFPVLQSEVYECLQNTML